MSINNKTWKRPNPKTSRIYADCPGTPSWPPHEYIPPKRYATEDVHRGTIACWKRKISPTTVVETWAIVVSGLFRVQGSPNWFCTIITNKGVNRACVSDLFVPTESMPAIVKESIQAIAAEQGLEGLFDD